MALTTIPSLLKAEMKNFSYIIYNTICIFKKQKNKL